MKKTLFISMITAAILSGCGNNEPTTEPAAANVEPAAPEASEPTATPEPTKEATKELTKTEQLALEYVNTYINGTDAEANQKFVADHVHPDATAFFLMGAGVSSEADDITNPAVKGSSDYELSGLKGKITLVEGDGGKGVIVLMVDNKIAMAYGSTDTVDEMKATYDEMKANFK